jgi:very-short-patch-repair endonuclease
MRALCNSQQHSYMKKRQKENLLNFSKAEQWAYEYLKPINTQWVRQAIWGCRLFDFFSIKRGIAVEIDGPEHNKDYDRIRDEYNYYRSGILVLRVHNFNEHDMRMVIQEITKGETRKQRRKRVRREIGLAEDAPMKDVLKKIGLKLAHGKWEPNTALEI